ncbi:MAG: glutathione S-transferase family protein [Deltaproteobacteria bacterium]|nr:glutathione S-transferase family protein [Deltaproteobacteria bacterium]
MKLYWHPFSVFPRRVRIVVREKGLACEEVLVDLPGGALRQPEFLRLNPFGQVPVLEDGTLVIAESVAILEYLEDRHPTLPLLPADAAARARARELMLWSGDYLAPAWKAVLAPLFSPSVQSDDPSVRCGREALARYLDVLEARLGDAPWLVGDYSLADVCHAPFVTVLGPAGEGDVVQARPRVAAWIERLAARPAVRDTAP